MNIITVVGKVDSRIIVYPLARALSMKGQTAIITDDGAYRRLYFGEEMSGNITGIDIFVGMKVDDSLIKMTDSTGVLYDNIVIVSATNVPKCSTGVIVCRGVDNSIGSEVSKDTEETAPDGEKVLKDSIEVGEKPCSEVIISFEQAPSKVTPAIQLRDMAIKYIYSCEEQKFLHMFDDKQFNKKLASIVEKATGINQAEMFNMLTTKDFNAGGKVMMNKFRKA